MFAVLVHVLHEGTHWARNMRAHKASNPDTRLEMVRREKMQYSEKDLLTDSGIVKMETIALMIMQQEGIIMNFIKGLLRG